MKGIACTELDCRKGLYSLVVVCEAFPEHR
jgi:hypothetical protein